MNMQEIFLGLFVASVGIFLAAISYWFFEMKTSFIIFWCLIFAGMFLIGQIVHGLVGANKDARENILSSFRTFPLIAFGSIATFLLSTVLGLCCVWLKS